MPNDGLWKLKISYVPTVDWDAPSGNQEQREAFLNARNTTPLNSVEVDSWGLKVYYRDQ